MLSSSNLPKLVVSDGIFRRRLRNSFEDGLPLHLPAGHLRHGKGVFRTGFVQVCEVYTHSPLPIFLFHHCSVG